MTDVYATAQELSDYLGGSYPMPSNPERLLARASEVISEATFGVGQRVWDGTAYYTGGYVDPLNLPTWVVATVAQLSRAVCAQVEFWLEFGEESDVVGLKGSLASGKLNISQLPPRLAPRARQALRDAGLFSAKVWAR